MPMLRPARNLLAPLAATMVLSCLLGCHAKLRLNMGETAPLASVDPTGAGTGSGGTDDLLYFVMGNITVTANRADLGDKTVKLEFSADQEFIGGNMVVKPVRIRFTTARGEVLGDDVFKTSYDVTVSVSPPVDADKLVILYTSFAKDGTNKRFLTKDDFVVVSQGEREIRVQFKLKYADVDIAAAEIRSLDILDQLTEANGGGPSSGGSGSAGGGASGSGSGGMTPSGPSMLTFSEPNGTADYVAQGAPFPVAWTFANSGRRTTISLYAKKLATGTCSSGTKIGPALSESDTGYIWTTPSNDTGNYYLCAHIDDLMNDPVDVWSAQPVRVRAKPVLAPRAEFWAKVGDPFQTTIVAESSDGPITYATVAPPPGTGMGSTTGVLTYLPTAPGPITFVVSATDTHGLAAQQTITVNVINEDICVWTGAVDGDFANSGNWTRCGGGEPTSTSFIVVPSTASNQPSMSLDTQIQGIRRVGDQADGGTLTLDHATLTLTAGGKTIGASIKLAGSTSTCTDCIVMESTGTDMYVTSGATITLLPGAQLTTSGFDHIYFGDAASSGHLVVDSAALPSSSWPILGSMDMGKITFYGRSADDPSTISLSGLTVQTREVWGNALLFDRNFKILRFDNIRFMTTDKLADTYMSFGTCDPAAFATTTFNRINFGGAYDSIYGTGHAVDATPCAGSVRLRISGMGTGYGAAYETDPNGVLDWLGNVDVTTTTPTLTFRDGATEVVLVDGAEGTNVELDVVDADDAAAQVDLYYGGLGATCATGLTGYTPFAQDVPAAWGMAVSWDTSALTSGAYSICAVLTDVLNQPIYQRALGVYHVIAGGSPAHWFRADLGVTVGADGRVNQWIDLGANKLDAAAPLTADQPTLIPGEIAGMPVMRFDNGRGLVTAPSSAFQSATSASWYVLGRSLPGIAENAPWVTAGDDSSHEVMGLWTGGPSQGSAQGIVARVEAGAAFGGFVDQVMPISTARVMNLIFDGAGATPDAALGLNLDGTGFTATYFGNQPTATSSVAGRIALGATGGVSLRGDIAEAIMFPRILSGTEQALVTQYLTGKYGIAIDYDDFSGATLDGLKWATFDYSGTGTNATLAGGKLVMSSTAAHSSLEHVAADLRGVRGLVKFGSDPYQHFGLATTYDQTVPMVMFTTYTSTSNLYARSYRGAGDEVIVNLGAIPPGFHEYYIRPTGTSYEFYIDRALVATLTTNLPDSTTQQAIGLSCYSPAPERLEIDWVRWTEPSESP